MIKKVVIGIFAGIISVGGVVSVAFAVNSHFAKQSDLEYAVGSIYNKFDYRELDDVNRQIEQLESKGKLTAKEKDFLRYLKKRREELRRMIRERS